MEQANCMLVFDLDQIIDYICTPCTISIINIKRKTREIAMKFKCHIKVTLSHKRSNIKVITTSRSGASIRGAGRVYGPPKDCEV